MFNSVLIQTLNNSKNYLIMKKILFFALICISTSNLFAQLSSPISFGVHAGLTSTKVDAKIPSIDDVKSKADNGMMLGAFARINLSKWYIQPELNYVSRKSTVQNVDVKLKSLDIPILLGYKIIKLPAFNVRGFAGPVASFNVGDNFSDLKEVLKQDVWTDKAKGAVWNAKVGLGADIWKLTLDIDYEFGLSDVSSEFLKKNKMFNVTVGFKLF